MKYASIQPLLKWTLLVIILLMVQDTYAQTSQEELNEEFRLLRLKSKTKSLSTIKEIKPRLEELKRNNNHYGVALAYHALYLANNNYENYKQASPYIDSLDLMVKKHNLAPLKLKLFAAKARRYTDQDKTDLNLLLIDSFYQEALLQKDTFQVADALALKGHVHRTRSEYDLAMQNFEKAQVLMSEINNKPGLAALYSKMGHYYAARGEHEKAQNEFLSGIKILRERKDTLNIILGLSNLTGQYMLDKKPYKTKEVLEERNRLIDLIEYPKAKKHTINTAMFYVQQEMFDEGLNELKLVEDYYTKNPNPKRLALVKHWQAITLRGLNKYPESAACSKEGFEISQSINYHLLSDLCAYTLFQTYHWRDQNKEAIEWLIKSQEIRDTIFEEEKASEMIELETKYETFKKEQEIEVLKAKSEADKAKRNQLWLFLLSISGIGLFAIYTLNMRRVKDKEIQNQKLKNVALEKEQLESRLSYKEKELTSQLLHIAKKNEQLIHISNVLKEVNATENPDDAKRLRSIQRSIKDDLKSSEVWEQFIQSFKSINQNFMKIMVEQFDLTANELRLASLLKMNFNNKEIASLLNITNEGIKKARYRLRKKLNLEVGESLEDLIFNIA